MSFISRAPAMAPAVDEGATPMQGVARQGFNSRVKH